MGLPPVGFSQTPEALLEVSQPAADLRFLASDELRGRATGTPEQAIAARYIAERMRAAGVKPAGISDFYQPVPLQKTAPAEAGQLEIPGLHLTNGTDFLVLTGGSQEIEAPAQYLGYGLDESGLGNDLYQGAAGKIVIVLGGRPGNPRPSLRATQEKRRLAGEAGALALIEAYPARAWNSIRPFLSRPRMSLRQEGEESAEIVFIALGMPDQDGPALLQGVSGASVELKSSGVSREDVKAYNVAGRIEGSDPLLRDQFVVLTAHYDHLGAGPMIPGSSADDFIFNGARDNAMGVAAVLAAAESLAERPPRRSVLLLAVTAEEGGLLGSRYYVEHPIVPLRNTVFVLNVDGGGFSDTGVVTVIGLERTSASGLIRRAAAAFGLEAIAGPPEAQDFFNRSDNLNFAMKGVPAPTFSPGFRTLKGSTMEHYHRPSDEAGDDFDYAYLLRFCQAYAASARAVADSGTQPGWVPGDDFAEAAVKLYRTPDR